MNDEDFLWSNIFKNIRNTYLLVDGDVRFNKLPSNVNKEGPITEGWVSLYSTIMRVIGEDDDWDYHHDSISKSPFKELIEHKDSKYEFSNIYLTSDDDLVVVVRLISYGKPKGCETSVVRGEYIEQHFVIPKKILDGIR